MKRFAAAALALLLSIGLFPHTAKAEFDPESVSTPYIMLMDADTGNILYERAADERAFPASTTKIMTCILAIEMCSSLEETVKVGSSVEDRGSLAGIVRGEEMSLIDMLYGVMLRSGNDAARAVAEHFGNGNESEFAALMNQKAAELGMTNTHFVKSNGLHKDDHYTTARDMAVLTRYAMQNETFRTIAGAVSHHVGPTNKDSDGYDWNNSNRLLYTPEDNANHTYEDITYPYAIGVKTGDTAQAGRCLVAAAKKDDVTLILVLFGDMENKVPTEYRFKNAALFFDWGFENYDCIQADTLDVPTTLCLRVNNAALNDAEGGELTLNVDLSGVRISGLKQDIAAMRGDPSKFVGKEVLDKPLEAPIMAGTVVGQIFYKYDGTPAFCADLVASRDVLAPDSTPLPNTSPSLEGRIGSGNDSKEKGDHSWLFWAIICFVVLLILVVLRLLSMRSRRRGLRRRGNARLRRR